MLCEAQLKKIQREPANFTFQIGLREKLVAIVECVGKSMPNADDFSSDPLLDVANRWDEYDMALTRHNDR